MSKTFRKFMPLLMLLSSGCVPNKQAGLRSIETKDWWRKGKDRFYLAQIRTNKLLAAGDKPLLGSSGQKLYLGQEVLVGVGCHKEGDNWKGKDPLNPTRGLHERRYFHPTDDALSDFPIARNPKNIQDGECEVLLGDTKATLEYTQAIKTDIQNASDLLARGLNSGIAISSTATCAATIACTVGAGALTAGAAIWPCLASAAGFGKAKEVIAPAVGKQLVLDLGLDAVKKTGLKELTIGAAKNTLASGSKSASANLMQTVVNGQLESIALDPVGTLITLGAGFIPCATLYQSWKTVVQDEKKRSNKFVLLDKFGAAMKYAREQLAIESPEFAKFKDDARAFAAKVPSPEKSAAYLAELNGYAVANFNIAQYGQVEQGWGNAQDFFALVKEFNGEIEAARSTAQKVSVPGGGIEAKP